MTADFCAKVFAAAILLAVIPSTVTAQDLSCERGDVEVRGLDFVGNRTFTGAELGNVIITTPSAWARRTFHLPGAAKRCLNRTEYANDRLRLLIFYRRRGFPDVSVDTTPIPAGSHSTRVRFTIHEGAPAILRSFVISGVDSVYRRDAVMRNLPIKSGNRFDRTLIDATMDTITRRLRNRGYPAVTARNVFAVQAGPHGQLADDSITIQPGAFTRIGDIRIAVDPLPKHNQQIANTVVRRLIRIDSGDVYREQALVNAQRDLYQTDAYLHVAMRLDGAEGQRVGRDSIAPLVVSLSENTMHAARIGAGYGTLDCFRVSSQLDDYSLFGGARKLELQGRVSKIGIGKPLAGAPNLCQQAKSDPYSSRLNYYLGATLRQPFFFGLRTVPTITAYTASVSEYNAYVRTTTIGGVASVTWQHTRRLPVTFNYALDYGRTEAQPALFCAVFNLCAQEDRERVQQTQRLAVASVVATYDGANDVANPTDGGVSRFEIRHASPSIFSDPTLQFNTLIGDMARYMGLGGGNVLALHVRGGAVYGKKFQTNEGFIPPQERMYGGGPNSVRGFAQNQLGAVTYLASKYQPVVVQGITYFRPDTTDSLAYRRAVPVGGNSLFVANIELRLRSPVLPDLLQFALFTDAGDVWNRSTGSATSKFKLKITPGVQAAALTPVGPVRVVVGYNPYDRPPGPLYYENTAANGGSLPCVSPNNGLVVTDGIQAAGSCAATFHPEKRTSFRSRLTFSLAIGQAF